MLKLFFFNELRRLLSFTYKKLTVSRKDYRKIDKVIYKLDKFSEKNNIDIQILISLFVFTYIDIWKEINLNNIYLKIDTFLKSENILQLSKLTIDSQDVFNLREDWNNMNELTSNDLPFTIRKILLSTKIRVYRNTYFKHSNNILYFVFVQKFIDEHKKEFPQIHNNIEFFLHLPIIKNFAREYMVFEYVDCYGSLSSYYKKAYGETDNRLLCFLKKLQWSRDVFDSYKKSKVWGAKYALQYLKDNVEEWL